MKKKTDSLMPVGRLIRVTDDFLPSPDALALDENKVKVTIVLDKSTVVQFKSLAKKYHAKYQRMMREVLKGYVKKYASLL
ncbi:MAG: hypothetical protein A2583_01785 [Bdellovibrionales bacterium RIFOXYD1_FULL_53_11]|nr:MAG: hypothetical protein A2583_01785 [Bdellovibrionales bacterium RIFOXYD1_FULL_53_11]